MCDHIVLEVAPFILIRTAGQGDMESCHPVLGCIDIKGNISMTNRNIPKEMGHIYLVLAPESGVRRLEFPGLKVVNEWRRLGVSVFNDRTFFERRKGKFLL